MSAPMIISEDGGNAYTLHPNGTTLLVYPVSNGGRIDFAAEAEADLDRADGADEMREIRAALMAER